MSLQLAAQELASRGRGNDSMLIHMSPREIKGLQAIALAHGGSLTVNPDTGLPEAGFLEDLLPTIAGIGLSFIPGVGPLAAAGLVGAGTAAITGDIGRGLMAGLGAWGGASLTGALAETGTQALAQQAANAGANLGEQALAETAKAALPAGYSTAGSAFTPTEMLAGSVAPQQFAGLQANAVQSVLTPQNFSNLGAEQIAGLQKAVPMAANPMDIARSAGIANMPVPTPTDAITAGARQQFSSGLGSGAYNLAAANPTATGAALLSPIIGALGAPGVVTPPDYTEEEKSKLKSISSDFSPSMAQPRYYQASYPVYGAEGGEVKGLAAGGQLYPQDILNRQPMSNMEVISPEYELSGLQPVRMNKGGPSHLGVKGVYTDTDPDTARKDAYEAAMIRLNKIRKGASLAGVKMPKTTVKGLGDIPVVGAAGGGHLGGYSDGGRMLKGPGDGMSDDIPATISGKQPARLADGEFVVPADVVSHLGNGSTDAGARKLYKMMDNIRKARTGRKRQAPAVKADKYLPAKGR